MSSTISLRLPWPPSTNSYYRNIKHGRCISKRGSEYREDAVVHVMQQGSPRVTGRVSVALELYPPNRAKRDIDNFVKPTLDALTVAGVWEDDSQVDYLIVRRKDVVKFGEVIVFIQEEPSP